MKRLNFSNLAAVLGFIACAPQQNLVDGQNVSGINPQYPTSEPLRVAQSMVESVQALVNGVADPEPANPKDWAKQKADGIYDSNAVIFPDFLKERGPGAFLGLLNFLKSEKKTPLNVREVCGIWVMPDSTATSVTWLFPNIAQRGTQWLYEVERMTATKRQGENWKLTEHNLAIKEREISSDLKCSDTPVKARITQSYYYFCGNFSKTASVTVPASYCKQPQQVNKDE